MLKKKIATILYHIMQSIRPLLGPDNQCRYHITCTEYARLQLSEEPLHKALWNISKRLLSCF
ncbi:MAG: membrane protein insertion efficiency factor YidD [Candidatus Babeliales bacterium]